MLDRWDWSRRWDRTDPPPQLSFQAGLWNMGAQKAKLMEHMGVAVPRTGLGVRGRVPV